MKPLSLKIAARCLLVLILGLGALFFDQPRLAAWDTVLVQAGNFAPGQLDRHYLKHGYQFGQISKQQYLDNARALLDAPPGGDVLEKVRLNGDIEHFRVSTGEFAVMTRRGRIRTYYRTNYWYWLRH